MAKLNNAQRNNLCKMIDTKVKAQVDDVDMSNKNILVETAKVLRRSSKYAPLMKKYTSLDDKYKKKKKALDDHYNKGKKELSLIDDERYEIEKDIKNLGINPKDGSAVCYEMRTIGGLKSGECDVIVPDSSKETWDCVKAGMKDAVADFQDAGRRAKEKIWLCDDKTSAEGILDSL
jgi:hypothetical protein